MIGIVLVTHGELSNGLYDAANLIIGIMNNIEVLNLNHGDCVEKLQTGLQEAVKKVDTGHGVAICTDLFGATPYNQALVAKQNMPEHSIEILSGVNLPMLIDLINHQILSSSLDNIMDSVVHEATKGIVLAKSFEDAADEF